MFELEANELVKDTKALPYDLDNYCRFSGDLLELPFPFQGGHRVPRFTLVSTKETKKRKAPADNTTTDSGLKNGSKTVWFRYYGRGDLGQSTTMWCPSGSEVFQFNTLISLRAPDEIKV